MKDKGPCLEEGCLWACQPYWGKAWELPYVSKGCPIPLSLPTNNNMLVLMLGQHKEEPQAARVFSEKPKVKQ